ncbi:hypothetical protein LUZ60_005150 [Juncus effusus]|nr:hypothetical protein LUZ60_005150 [Juncus effusus]
MMPKEITRRGFRLIVSNLVGKNLRYNCKASPFSECHSSCSTYTDLVTTRLLSSHTARTPRISSANERAQEAIDANPCLQFCSLHELEETHVSDEEQIEDGTDALYLFDKTTASHKSQIKGETNKERTEEEDDEEDETDWSGHPLVRETCRLISLSHEWNPKLESQLRHLLRTLKPPQIRSVLRSQKDERASINFFYWADRQWRYRHAPEVYDEMLKLLSKTKLCEASRRIMILMIRRGIKRKAKFFGYLMVSYSRAGKLRSALRVLHLMQKDRIAPDLSVCNTAIHVLIMAKRLEKALSFLDRMQRVEINPNVITYNCLIKGFCESKQVHEALDLIKQMKLNGCEPDKVSFYTILTFLCKEKRVEEVRELLKLMQDEYNLILDQVTYNTIIHVLSKHGHANEALEFVKESELNGFRVDSFGYSAVLNAFCLNGLMDQARELISKMSSKGFHPDVVTYTTIVNGFCKLGQIDEAKKIIKYMYEYGCKPNIVTYTCILNGLCKVGKSLEALEMINKSEKEFWNPNLVTYSVVMHGLRREGKLNEATNLVYEMIKKGFFPTPVEINLFIRALCEEGKNDEARTFLQNCQSKGCFVNVVNFTTLIHGFCKKGDLNSVFSLLDDMYLNNKHPDAYTYTIIIDILGKKERFQEAINLIKKMLHRGVDPTPVTYRTIIHRFCEKNKVEELTEILDNKMLIRKEYRNVYNLIMEKLIRFGHLEKAYEFILPRVLRTGSKSDVLSLNLLIEGFLKKGLVLNSYKVACRVFKRNLVPDIRVCERVSKRLVLEGSEFEGRKLLEKFVERGIIRPPN